VVAAVYVNLHSYTSYIGGSGDKALEIRLLHDFRAFSVLCKVFSSGALLHIRQNTHPQPLPKGGEIASP